MRLEVFTVPHDRSALALVIASLALASCAGSGIGGPAGAAPLLPPSGTSQVSHFALPDPNAPQLVTFNDQTKRLMAWPIQRGGGSDPEPISGPIDVGSAGGLAVIGDVIAIADQFPPKVALYNLKTRTTRVLDDPFGTPVGIAVGKDESIFVINIAKHASPVTWYKAPAHRPVELNCPLLGIGEAIAVDNEGDIFIQGYPKVHGSVVEIPNGPNGPQPQNCGVLPLKGGFGYVAGIAVNPNNDDLLTLDDPSLCAGGSEGRLTTYPKPYREETGRSRIIGMNCTGGLALNADASLVFTADTDVSQSNGFILQRGYPNGARMGIYHANSFSSFVVVPNILPN